VSSVSFEEFMIHRLVLTGTLTAAAPTLSIKLLVASPLAAAPSLSRSMGQAAPSPILFTPHGAANTTGPDLGAPLLRHDERALLREIYNRRVRISVLAIENGPIFVVCFSGSHSSHREGRAALRSAEWVVLGVLLLNPPNECARWH
jgi:hypothetical protein